MGFSSIWHWVIVLLIVLLLFGAGKLPKVMGDLAKGIKNFKAGLKDEDEDAAVVAKPQVVSSQPVPPAAGPTASGPAAAGPTVVTPAPDHGVKKDETART
ncbi:twin-arginine translocase TatA/TatE family subunit [Azospirillum rugosum]|uniref:Sec-independent protein translocase protein TatA n=1 Tax=Azospirillum rugosum TaxID=416170 RepID=A0ABS4SDZ8_9PROT|nr:twin-arginine translocase TatA/TatE family subunit [Azospirillum rugosum]MBP2290799.1 sec-independent protein translocase protein TatA [Azospirillum rugosum]MDQ0529666.1 sec-independent protein translocase protein TatA [Azospirillum rugosum]